jgi:hypothetical protein
VAVDVPRDDPPPFLPRVLPVVAVRSDDDVTAYAGAHRLPLQALGVVSADDAALALAARLGAVRVAPFGSLQAPPAGGHHGGAPRIADFVRWLDRE